MDGKHLLILGASARAAAFSALRAGLRPWSADLFGDLDLRARCHAVAVPTGRYPNGFLDLVGGAPAGPWIYTGALENRRTLVRRLARLRPLWGNDSPALAVVRSPGRVHSLLSAAGLPCPAFHNPARLPSSGRRWLVKPIAGAGGIGIRFWDGRSPPGGRPSKVYFQEFMEGESCAAVFLADGTGSRLLGVTRQLVGEAWLGAAPFRYCGSVGPLSLPPSASATLGRIGQVLAAAAGLRGLFGVDFVLRDTVPWPVEVNPRYTASVEVLEYATGLRALALHRGVFDPGAGVPVATQREPSVVGKAVLFARAPLVVPAEGAWEAALSGPVPVEEMPAFADIPPAGQRIDAGRPVLTFFARAGGEADCLAALRRAAADLDARLFGG